jgi:hypothetical protein
MSWDLFTEIYSYLGVEESQLPLMVMLNHNQTKFKLLRGLYYDWRTEEYFKAMLNHTEDEEMVYDYVPLEAVVEEDERETLEQFAEAMPAADYADRTERSEGAVNEDASRKKRTGAVWWLAIAAIAACAFACRTTRSGRDMRKR